MFSEEKVAQMSAYLLEKSGGNMKYIKLMKLLYLADKESYRLYGDSMTGDNPVSMRHGPVLSQTFDLMKEGGEPNTGWARWIKGEADYYLSVSMPFSREDLDELSQDDVQILNNIHSTFGHYDPWDLVHFTHDNCSEWRDPQGSSKPIMIYDVLKDLGKSNDEIVAVLKRNTVQTQLERSLKR